MDTYTKSKPHRTHNGVLSVCVSWKITKNCVFEKGSNALRVVYGKIAISMEIFSLFIPYSFNRSEAGRKTVSDDHFVGSDQIMQKTTAEYDGWGIFVMRLVFDIVECSSLYACRMKLMYSMFGSLCALSV